MMEQSVARLILDVGVGLVPNAACVCGGGGAKCG